MCISDRMDFLFKDRGSGKRTIKPSKDSESLEACMAAEESDDSDFEVFEKAKSGKYFMSTDDLIITVLMILS